MNIFTVDLKNQPGELAHMCDALAQRDINIELAGVTAGDHGLVCFTASDEDAARAALDSASVSFTEHPALQVRSADRPGEAAKIARKLSDAHVNIEYLIPTSICGGEVIFTLTVDKPNDARTALGEQIVA
jgi:hypothetical protein